MLEELSCNEKFRSWFLDVTLGIEEPHSDSSVRRSVTQSTGESDLELSVTLDGGGRLRLLIENKVDAAFQPEQANRYRQRAANYLSCAECDIVKTILVAPERYFGNSEELTGFDHRLTYEQLREWFERSDLGTRAEYKSELLSGAIEKSTLGYQPLADAPVSDFWHEYWRVARQLAPQLQMREPESKPARAGFVYFRPASLPKGIEICHKLPHGHVDLQINGWGSRLHEVALSVESRLEPGMSVASAAKSAAIRLSGDRIDTAQPFASQEDAVREGIAAAARLLTWYASNSACFTRFVKGAV
jgi:hypothetical protein